MSARLITERLELVAGTAALLNAEIGDRAELARLLRARVPTAWPPPLNDEHSMRWSIKYLEENPEAAGWVSWYFILRGEIEDGRVAVGNGGFKGKPAPDGTAEVGYSVLEEFQGRGYATEATRSLIAWAFGHPEVTRVIAETYKELTKSIRVMEKNGLICIGPGSEERVIRYSLERDRGARP